MRERSGQPAVSGVAERWPRATARGLVALCGLAAALVTLGCEAGSSSGGSRGDLGQRKIRAVATIGMITDIVRVVGGERIEVEGLMGAGVDPHLYKPSEGDVRKLSGADIIFYNGLNLEGKMSDLFVRLSSKRPTVAVTEEIDPGLLREPPEFLGHYDPHVWFDVTLWMAAVRRVGRALEEIDPAHAQEYASRAAAYVAELEELDSYVEGRVAEIPKERRVLVTAHDAFGYFGQRYDIEVVGLQGISTATDFSVNDVQRIVGLVVARQIKAIFVETSVPVRAIEAVQQGSRDRGHGVAIGGLLYSDAMGDPGTPDGTYIGMIRHNVDTIVEALR